MSTEHAPVPKDFGPARIKLTPKGDGPVAFKLLLVGVPVTKGTVEPGQSVSTGGAISGFKIEMEITASTDEPRRVTVDGDLTVPIKGATHIGPTDIPLAP